MTGPKASRADLVAAAKRQEVAAEFQKNSISGLAMEWSNALAVDGRESPGDDTRAIRQVTVADVNRVASRYLDPEYAISAILTPQPSGQPVSALSSAGAESFAPKESKPAPLPEWARKAAESLSIPESTVHPTVITLANGLKLIVQPESISDTISVAGHIRNNPDLEAPKAKDGLDQALDQLLTYGTVSVPADVLLQAKVLLLQQIPLSESSVSAIAGGFLARTNNDLPLDEPTQAANRYAAMTAQQVQAAFAN